MTGVVLPARADVVEYGARRAFVTLAVIVAAMIEVIDTTVVNVALPSMQGNIGADIEQGTWIITAYVMANVIVIPLTPWFQARFGRRRYFVVSIVLFTFASLLCGLATSLGQLVLFRLFQGLAGGGLIATAQTILNDTYPREQQPVASGIFAMGVIVGPALGPLLGGVLTDSLDWRWAFFINLPIGTFAAVVSAMFLRDPEKPRRLPLDVLGLVLLAMGLGTLQYVLDQGQMRDWFSDSRIVVASIVSAIGLMAFVLWELFGTEHPAVNLRALRYRAVAVGSILSGALGFTLFAGIVLVPQYAQSILGFTATMAGQLFLVQAGTSGLLTFVAVGLLASKAVPARYLVLVGLFFMGIGNVALFRVETSGSDFHALVGPLVLLGIGMSQLFVPISVASVGAVPASIVPDASAFTNLSRQIAGSISTAVVVTIAQRTSIAQYAQLAGGVTLANGAVVRFIAQNGGSLKALPKLFLQVQMQAQVLGFAHAALVTGVVGLVLAPLALLLGRSNAHGVTEFS